MEARGWHLVNGGDERFWRRVLGSFWVEIQDVGTINGRTWRLVEGATSTELWSGSTIVSLDRARRGLEHLLATAVHRRTGEINSLD